MEYSSYDMETRSVTLHQTADYGDDDDMKAIHGEGWIDLLILDAKPKLDLGNMDSGIVFDHGSGASMGSLATRAHMNNNMAGGVNQNGNMAVNDSQQPQNSQQPLTMILMDPALQRLPIPMGSLHRGSSSHNPQQ